MVMLQACGADAEAEPVPSTVPGSDAVSDPAGDADAADADGADGVDAADARVCVCVCVCAGVALIQIIITHFNFEIVVMPPYSPSSLT